MRFTLAGEPPTATWMLYREVRDRLRVIRGELVDLHDEYESDPWPEVSEQETRWVSCATSSDGLAQASYCLTSPGGDGVFDNPVEHRAHQNGIRQRPPRAPLDEKDTSN